jgi:hypothetical protein
MRSIGYWTMIRSVAVMIVLDPGGQAGYDGWTDIGWIV